MDINYTAIAITLIVCITIIIIACKEERKK